MRSSPRAALLRFALLISTVLPVANAAGNRMFAAAAVPEKENDMDIGARFRTLADEWEAHRQEVLFSSDINDMLRYPAFAALVALGRPSVPLIIERYRTDSLPWCFVLQEITRGPVWVYSGCFEPEETRRAWLGWWELEKGRNWSETEEGEIGGVAALSLEDLAAEYRERRRSRQEASQSAEPQFHPWWERMHLLMSELGRRLGDARVKETELIRLMGPPDDRSRRGDTLFFLVLHDSGPAQGMEMLAYWWRGGHDFLYFLSDGQTILDSSWWMAGE